MTYIDLDRVRRQVMSFHESAAVADEIERLRALADDLRDQLDAERTTSSRLVNEVEKWRSLADDLWTVHNMPIDHPDRDAENRRVAARYREARQQ